MRGIFLFLPVVFLAACGTPPAPAPSPNRLVFALNDSVQASFPLTINDSAWVMSNGGEEIQLNQIASDTYHVPVFNGTLTLESGEAGYWTDSLRPKTESGAYRVPFTLTDAASTNGSQSMADFAAQLLRRTGFELQVSVDPRAFAARYLFDVAADLIERKPWVGIESQAG